MMRKCHKCWKFISNKASNCFNSIGDFSQKKNIRITDFSKHWNQFQVESISLKNFLTSIFAVMLKLYLASYIPTIGVSTVSCSNFPSVFSNTVGIKTTNSPEKESLLLLTTSTASKHSMPNAIEPMHKIESNHSHSWYQEEEGQLFGFSDSSDGIYDAIWISNLK